MKYTKEQKENALNFFNAYLTKDSIIHFVRIGNYAKFFMIDKSTLKRVKVTHYLCYLTGLKSNYDWKVNIANNSVSNIKHLLKNELKLDYLPIIEEI